MLPLPPLHPLSSPFLLRTADNATASTAGDSLSSVDNDSMKCPSLVNHSQLNPKAIQRIARQPSQLVKTLCSFQNEHHVFDRSPKPTLKSIHHSMRNFIHQSQFEALKVFKKQFQMGVSGIDEVAIALALKACKDDGEEDFVFTIKLHIGGDMIFKPRFSYKNGFVEYFDHFNCDEGSILDLRRMVKMLRFCDKKVQFWYEYGNTRRPKLMKLSSDADILGLITDIPVNKELDIYVEHLYDDQWDYDVEISRELGDDTLLEDEILSEDESCDNGYENQADVEGPAIEINNLRDTATSSKPKGGLGEQVEDVVEIECNLSEQVLRSLCDSDSDGAVHGPLNVFEERNLKKEGFKFVLGMVFSSTKEFKWAVEYHEAMRQKDVLFKKNEARRVRVICRDNQICQWSIFCSRSNPDSPFTVKTYNNVHTCGNQDENKLVTSGFLAKVYKDEFRVNKEWGRGPFQEHVKSKFHCQLTRNQAYLAKKKALRQIDGLDSEQFNELNDYCEELRRSNPGSSVKMKVDKESKEKSARFSAYKYVDEIYQVDDENFKPFKVDLSARQCSCRKWDLSGIPCTHAIAAIRKKGDLPEHHVHDCYTVEHYLRSYGPAILPIRAKELWHKTAMPPPLPPKYKPQPGRPKKEEEN
nr:pentatricopeptide repeat-containing protein At4g32430, mitochondrial-like [Ipomoea batatas]